MQVRRGHVSDEMAHGDGEVWQFEVVSRQRRLMMVMRFDRKHRKGGIVEVCGLSRVEGAMWDLS